MPRDIIRYPEGVAIETLVGKSSFHVYTFDQDQQKMTLSEVEKVWRTGEKEVWRLRFGGYSGVRKENYKEGELLATPEHLVMLDDGSYKPLKALRTGESLKVFKSSHSTDGYRQIGLGVGQTISEHRGLLEFALGRKSESTEVAHQLDRRRKMDGITSEEIRERYADNHQVISVEPTGITVPVYDMKVKRTHNFVANGIVVHNSGATPGEAVSWGKVDPDRLPDAVVCYVDSTIALPLITAYALARHEPREPKRLYERRGELMELLMSEYQKSKRR
ncbi:MAG: deoxyhypusine synthase family protein [Pyrinomonadaceae bacterium]|nr:deoxyhypusine synthase family protein [Pyrinomonadaceae bacterium]